MELSIKLFTLTGIPLNIRLHETSVLPVSPNVMVVSTMLLAETAISATTVEHPDPSRYVLLNT